MEGGDKKKIDALGGFTLSTDRRLEYNVAVI